MGNDDDIQALPTVAGAADHLCAAVENLANSRRVFASGGYDDGNQLLQFDILCDNGAERDGFGGLRADLDANDGGDVHRRGNIIQYVP